MRVHDDAPVTLLEDDPRPIRRPRGPGIAADVCSAVRKQLLSAAIAADHEESAGDPISARWHLSEEGEVRAVRRPAQIAHATVALRAWGRQRPEVRAVRIDDIN